MIRDVVRADGLVLQSSYIRRDVGELILKHFGQGGWFYSMRPQNICQKILGFLGLNPHPYQGFHPCTYKMFNLGMHLVSQLAQNICLVTQTEYL